MQNKYLEKIAGWVNYVGPGSTKRLEKSLSRLNDVRSKVQSKLHKVNYRKERFYENPIRNGEEERYGNAYDAWSKSDKKGQSPLYKDFVDHEGRDQMAKEFDKPIDILGKRLKKLDSMHPKILHDYGIGRDINHVGVAAAGVGGVTLGAKALFGKKNRNQD